MRRRIVPEVISLCGLWSSLYDVPRYIRAGSWFSIGFAALAVFIFVGVLVSGVVLWPFGWDRDGWDALFYEEVLRELEEA
jgi:hypothetical protein